MKRVADCSDSDDSIEPSTCKEQKNDVQDSLNKQYGIGASLLAQMGYIPGQGLGSQQQGIVEPVHQIRRNNKGGLGASPRAEIVESAVKAEDSCQTDTFKQSSKETTILTIKVKKKELKRMLEAVNQLGPDNLSDFIRQFSSSTYWFNLKVWEAVLVWSYFKYKQVSCNDFANHIDELRLIHEVVPPSHWIEFIKQTWLPKFMNLLARSSEANADADADDVICALELLKWLDRLPGPDGRIDMSQYPDILFSLTRSRNAKLISSQNKIDLVASIFPQYPKLLQLAAHKLDRHEQVVLSKYDRVGMLLNGIEHNDLERSFEILRQANSQFPLREEELKCIMEVLWPKWFADLVKLLTDGQLSVHWWNLWKSKMTELSIGNTQKETWILRGINCINSFFDTHELPKSDRLWEPTLGDVLEHFCHIHKIKCTFKTDSSGTISRNERSIDWEIKDDFLYLAKSKSPVSFSIIKEYI